MAMFGWYSHSPRASPSHRPLTRLSLLYRAPASGTCGSAPLALHSATQSAVIFSAQRTLDCDRTDNHHPSGSQNIPKRNQWKKKAYCSWYFAVHLYGYLLCLHFMEFLHLVLRRPIFSMESFMLLSSVQNVPYWKQYTWQPTSILGT